MFSNFPTNVCHDEGEKIRRQCDRQVPLTERTDAGKSIEIETVEVVQTGRAAAKEPNDPDGCASIEKARAALARLTLHHADMLRLHRYGGSLISVLRLRLVEPEDLIHEAFARVLKGRRRWPRKVPFLNFSCGVIKSIAWEKWVEENRNVPESELPPDFIANHIDPSPGPEHMIVTKETLEDILWLFGDDKIALAILEKRLMGYSPEEFKKELGITENQYNAALKRIRLKLPKLRSALAKVIGYDSPNE